MERISVVGLGKLGLCLAACYAERGFETLGVDIEERVVRYVNEGRAPWFEPQLDDLLSKHGGKRLRATTQHKEAIEETDITIVLVPTPSNPDGTFSNRFIESALRALAEAYGKSKKEFHDFVISSTVMPGSTEGSFIPILETRSGRSLNKDFSICYDPDFVALGSVVKGFIQPELVIIGETSPEAGNRVEGLHRKMCENNPAISRMSIISSELAKVCLNVYITAKISIANSIANLCERIPGADVDAITRAIGADKRISPYYFQGGLSFGGTCFPRDIRAYLSLAERFSVQADIVRAVDQVNKYQDKHLAEVVLSEIDKADNKKIGIMGLSFTMNTPVITESPAIKLIYELIKHDLRILAYDRLAIDNARSVLGSAIEYTDSAESLINECDLVVLSLRDPAIKYVMESSQIARSLTVIDCWRMLDRKKLNKSVRYVPLGSLFI
jgi:UDPglucose 6-dehydrogenase